MESKTTIKPLEGELPSHFADRLGVEYASKVSQEHKKQNGQFFTPSEIASLMASYGEFHGEAIRILDPGCGTAVLACALIEHITKSNKKLKLIELIGYETDSELIPISLESLAYLEIWGKRLGIKIESKLFTEDFILHNADSLKEPDDLFASPIVPYDIVISNPPYFKLPIDDIRAIVAKVIVSGHPNIYSVFMAISARLLKLNGQLIFITPRSYASGGYFKIFRTYFFKIIEMDKVHLFVSRKDAFTREKVLQELVIIKGRRVSKLNPEHEVMISSSHGLKDIRKPMLKLFKHKELIDLGSNEKILFLPTSNSDENILNIVKNWNGNLQKYNIQISTGPVVAFRSWNFIQETFQNGIEPLAPLFWLHNVNKMVLEWPISKPGKGQYIKIQNDSKSILIPNKNYIFLRRFSSKDDKSRLIAAPYFCNYPDSNFIGVENKVNYIYRKGGHLERNEVMGLCALLNSNLFDNYFRIFNGNVNVSATELREMKIPDLEEINLIGESIILNNNYSVEYLNEVIDQFFNQVEQPVQ
ncbi:MAG: N-6 DNA methylase [Saprospiraceae bacterium]|nr:N-6 DNA methylase [Saprospiraceae bacterium]